jgi:hypothetical protein
MFPSWFFFPRFFSSESLVNCQLLWRYVACMCLVSYWYSAEEKEEREKIQPQVSSVLFCASMRNTRKRNYHLWEINKNKKEKQQIYSLSVFSFLLTCLSILYYADESSDVSLHHIGIFQVNRWKKDENNESDDVSDNFFPNGCARTKKGKLCSRFLSLRHWYIKILTCIHIFIIKREWRKNICWSCLCHWKIAQQKCNQIFFLKFKVVIRRKTLDYSRILLGLFQHAQTFLSFVTQLLFW